MPEDYSQHDMPDEFEARLNSPKQRLRSLWTSLIVFATGCGVVLAISANKTPAQLRIPESLLCRASDFRGMGYSIGVLGHTFMSEIEMKNVRVLLPDGSALGPASPFRAGRVRLRLDGTVTVLLFKSERVGLGSAEGREASSERPAAAYQGFVNLYDHISSGEPYICLTRK